MVGRWFNGPRSWYACPFCDEVTLRERGGFELWLVCYWEDERGIART
jgi:hypothetical protein